MAICIIVVDISGMGHIMGATLIDGF